MSRLPPISSLLMSPPEGELMHNFNTSESKETTKPSYSPDASQFSTQQPQTPMKHKEEPAHQPPSPPESPATAAPRRTEHEKVLPQSNLSLVDPPLYPKESQPDDDRERSVEEPPLFTNVADPIDAAIQQHIRDNARHYMKGKSKGDKRTLRYQLPSVDDYRLTLSFVSHLGQASQPITLKRLREEDQENYPAAKRLGVHPRTPLAQYKQTATPTSSSPASSQVVKKVANPKKQASSSPRVRAIPRAAPGEGGRRAANTPHTRVREPKRPIDVNWKAITDYSPSTSVLGDNPKALKADWEGNPLDLSNDPDREELHDAELYLASALRLSCARYLTCKRRIFAARVETLKIGKEFKKTDAQQACQIDVNKASKIWTAFEKVGWLQPQLFKQYL